jgi:hypothetical protein
MTPWSRRRPHSKRRRLSIAAGKLPTGSKVVINAGGAAYETARTSWATWRDISLGVKAGDANVAQVQLNSDMLAMAHAIAKVVALTGGKH